MVAQIVGRTKQVDVGHRRAACLRERSLYCHDNGHQRQLDTRPLGDGRNEVSGATHTPFGGLAELLKRGS